MLLFPIKMPHKAPLVKPIIDIVGSGAGSGITLLNNKTLSKPASEQAISRTIIKKALKPEPIDRLYKPIAKDVGKIPKPAKANNYPGNEWCG
jgi:hypothetical protein